MLGSRALYHDGWKSVVFHPTPFIAYDGTDVSKPFDDDIWELYHVAEDFSEVDDLAEKEPEQLEKMKELWWEEAAKYQVLPLNNEPGKFPDRRWRRERYELYSGIGPLPEVVAPNLRNRGFTIAAALDGAGRRPGRRRDRRPRQPLRRLRAVRQGPPAALRLQLRRHRASPTWRPSVRAARRRGGGQGSWSPVGRSAPTASQLWYGDVPVGEGKVERRTPVTYGMIGFAVGYQPGGSICPDLDGRCEITPGVLGKVVIEPEGRPRTDPARGAPQGPRHPVAVRRSRLAR